MPVTPEDAWYYWAEQDSDANWQPWTPAEVEAAIDAHDKGDFSLSAQLARDFGRDERIPGVRANLVNGFVGRSGVPLTFEASKRGDQRRTAAIAAQVEDRWWDWLPEDVLSRLVEDYADLGIAVARVPTKETADEWAPEVTPWPMEHVKLNEATQQLETHDRAGNKLVITPGEGWLVIGSIRAKSWLRGAVRPLGRVLVKRAYIDRAWIRWCEKHGNPLLGIEEPIVGNDSAKKAQAEAFYRRFQRGYSNGIVRLPKGSDDKSSYALKYIEASGKGWEGCDKLLQRTDTAISIIYTGTNLSVEVKGGSFAATNAHMTVRGDLLASLAEALATAFRAQLICWWGRNNVEGWSDTLAPWPRYQVTPPEAPEAIAERQKTKAQALRAWWDLGLDVDLVAAARAEGIPLKSEQLREPKPTPTPPAQGDPPQPPPQAPA